MFKRSVPNTKMTTRTLPHLVGFLLIALQTNLTANELDLRINGDSLHGNYNVASNTSKTHFGLGYFYKNDDIDINVANVDLEVKDQTAIANMPATVGLGLQGNFFKADEFKGSAVGVGGSFRINLPQVPGISLETALYYSPKVLSFGDSDEFRRFRFQVNYRLIENADISVGYQYLNVGVDESGDNYELESRAFLGIKLK